MCMHSSIVYAQLEMAATRAMGLLLLTLLLSRKALCQCYSELSCGGDVLPSNDQRDCCVMQNGLSYNDAGTCRPCIGVLLIALLNTLAMKQKPCVSVVHGFPQAVYDVDEDDRLNTEFALNVVGTTQLPSLVISGTVTAHTDGTAGKWHHLYTAGVISSIIYILCS